MYNSFGLLLHELDQAEAGLEQATHEPSDWSRQKPIRWFYPIQNHIKSMSIFRDENTLKPFLLQNFGIGLGFAIIAILAYAEFNWSWPW